MMVVQGKRALVVGMARSGVAAAKTLYLLGADVTINDMKTEEALGEGLNELKDMPVHRRLGQVPDDLIHGMDFIVISPSVPIDSPFINKARESDIPVLSEIELGYRLTKAPIVAITGTNGKTTTTALTGEIFKTAGESTHIVGNIGIPFTGKVMEIRDTDVVVAEISSFQLEAIHDFHPKVSAILNITEDHMNRHKTMDVYIQMKARIFENQLADDYLVLNFDDELVAPLAKKSKARVLYFSRKHEPENGAFVRDDSIVFRMDGKEHFICRVEDVRIPGMHNLENALAATVMASVMGVQPEKIREALKTFPGVEHRIELVDTINGVQFINDSKGTNPDASIKAIEAMKSPTIIIAGGMDKGSDFSSYIDAFQNKVIAMIVLGETADKLERTAREKGFHNIHKVAGIKEAVEKAFEIAVPGDVVLLSPACASWDMFKDFEERGRVFKEAVLGLRR